MHLHGFHLNYSIVPGVSQLPDGFVTKITILAMDNGHPGQMEAMEERFRVIRLRKPDPDRTIREHSADIKAITTFLTPVSRNLIEALPNLEIIAAGAAGLDHIDTETAQGRGVVVTNTPGVLTDDTADIALFLMLAVARRAVEGDAYIRAGLWRSHGPLPPGTSLSRKTAGIVGLGRIGSAVAARAAAFNMDIAYYGPTEKPDEPYRYYNSLEVMAKECDFLILTCSGGEKTRGLVDGKILRALGPKGFVINVSRGSVLKEQDLLIALRNKDIAGAALDVYENEPDVPPELVTMDNVVLTPHIGSATLETRTKMGRIVVENLSAHFEARPLLTAVGG